MKRIIGIILYVWQLPQNLLGKLLVFSYDFQDRFPVGRSLVHVSRSFPGGISLGRYIIVKVPRDTTVAHEYGHARQSLMLGPLYLPVVGLWSALRAGLHLYKRGEYYNAFPEDWADRLGGVKKDKYGSRYV